MKNQNHYIFIAFYISFFRLLKRGRVESRGSAATVFAQVFNVYTCYAICFRLKKMIDLDECVSVDSRSVGYDIQSHL